MPTQLTNIEEIRRKARQDIEQGAITPVYGSDLNAVLQMLNEALATELVCYLRYKRHYFMAQGIHSEAVKQEFNEHALQELAHADQLAARIIQLGGEPNFNPEGLIERSHAQYVEATSLVDMIKEDLIAERIAIQSYTEMIRFVGEGDPTTRRLIESILAVEEEHAEDLFTLIQHLAKVEPIRESA